MSEMEPLNQEQRRIQEVLRSLEEPRANPDFAARLRAEFVAGTLESSGSSTTEARPSARVIPLRWAAALSAAAAVALIVGVLNQGPRWSLSDFSGDYVLVDGERVSAADLPGTDLAGRWVEMPEGTRMELVSPGTLMLQLNEGLAMTVPATPRRWFGRDVATELDGDGILRVTTGPTFPGRHFRILADAAEVDVTGTTFAVIHHRGQACVCVLEGTVQACAPEETKMTPIGPGRRMTFVEENPVASQGEMLPSERDALNDLRARAFAPQSR